MNKPLAVIYGPVDTYSGYGARARDIVKSIISLKKEEWNIKIIPCMWGNTPWGFVNDNPEWKFMEDHYHRDQQFAKQPDYFFWITVPNEVQPVGKWNCLLTAGIETTVCDVSWIEGINRMDLTLVSSQHAKTTFEKTVYEKRNNHTQQVEGLIQVNKPIEVLFEGADVELFKALDKVPNNPLVNELNNINENFCFLYTGMWTGGELFHDRKNVGMLIKVFLEAFKNKTFNINGIKSQPALILKTNGATTSILDREEILKKIDSVRKTCKGNLPNVYLLHGDLTNENMNVLYNHPKVKAMVSLTKGEGFGRPLLEFSLTRKPIITSNWSGHLDFLKPEFTKLIDGEVKPIHPSAVIPNMLLQDASWFEANPVLAGQAMVSMVNDYGVCLVNAKRQAFYSKTNFSFDKMTEKLKDILAKAPQPVKFIPITLPPLKKKIELPTLIKKNEQ
jgi:glycosyltransferase involved in cell wall biosynthesis